MSRSALTVLLGLVALGVLWLLCVRQHGPAIEADLASRAHDALAELDMGQVEVRATGRVLRLEGSVASETERTRAAEIALSTYGVRAIDNQLHARAAGVPPELEAPKPAESPPEPEAPPVPSTKPYRTGLELDETGGIRLTGSVPNEAGRGTLRSLAGARAPGGRVHDELTVRSDAPEGWGVVIGAVGQSLEEFETARVALVDRELSVTATARSPNARDAAVGTIRRALPSGFDASLDISTPGGACQQRFDAALAKAKIRFATSSATIQRRSHGLLDALAGIASQCPSARIVIEGHTDSEGSDEENQRLSQARASSVHRYLVNKGVEDERLRAIGRGETQPIADNSTSRGRARNRRIEFKVQGE